MKKKIVRIIPLVIIFILLLVHTILNRNESSMSCLLLKNSLVFIISILISIFINNKKLRIGFYAMSIISIIIGSVFSSFDYFAFLLMYLFIILITITFMVKDNSKFELAIVEAVSGTIGVFILISLVDLLKYSKLLLIIMALGTSIYLYINRKQTKEIINKININSFLVFTALFIVAILGGVVRYIHSWDEYSYWAYAAKICINEKSFLSVISKLGNTRNYPPVATIWHYIVSSFTKGFSEPNLYIGMTLISFIYFIPAITHLIEKNKKYIVIFVIAILSFPLLFSGAYTYTLIYADLLLAAMCTAAIIFNDLYKKGEINKKTYIFILLLIVMLKPNGFVFSLSLLLLFYIRDLLENDKPLKSIFKELTKYIVPGLLIMLLFVGWTLMTKSTLIESTSYDYNLMPAALKANIGPKLESKFILNFITNLIKSIDKPVILSFIEIPLFVYLIILGGLLYYAEEDKSKGIIRILLPYVISYIVFFIVTALSLFVMFTKYEAESLASFERYLSPINISFFIYALYKFTSQKKNIIIPVISIVIIGLVGFSQVTFFVTDIRSRRDTLHVKEVREDRFKEIINYTEKDAKVFVINQEDEDSIMPLWYARYYCYPRYINSSSTAITWKVKTKENSWDLKKWGLTDEKLEKHLIDYDFDYIFFYTKTDELEDELDEFVDNKNEYDKGKLFKIIKENNHIKFELIK